jgi:hypothetical protein
MPAMLRAQARSKSKPFLIVLLASWLAAGFETSEASRIEFLPNRSHTTISRLSLLQQKTFSRDPDLPCLLPPVMRHCLSGGPAMVHAIANPSRRSFGCVALLRIHEPFAVGRWLRFGDPNSFRRERALN